MIKRIFYTFLTIILFLSCNKKDLIKIEMNDKVYSFELANTSELRKKGLMFRKNLDKDSGMLFVYPKKTILCFYMKNTLIPLDIAFINDKYEIVDIFQMQPLDETSILSSDDAQYALEVNRGFFDRANLKVGNKIKILTPIQYSQD